VALTEAFDSARSSFVLNATQVALAQKGLEKALENTPTSEGETAGSKDLPLFIPDDEDEVRDDTAAKAQDTIASESDDQPMLIDDTDVPTKEPPTSTSPPRKETLLPNKRPRSAPPDSGSDGEVAHCDRTRSPSPALPPEPSSSSQRLDGPGRTPARVEQILSENTSRTGRVVQMVLDTTGASWNLKPGQEGPSRKRPTLGNASGSSSGRSARADMRARLAGFAREGARVVQDRGIEGDSDSPEEEEVTELTAADEKQKSIPQKMDVDVDELEVGNDGHSSTDVVDETMAIDSSESEDEPLKPPNDISRAPATASSSTSPRTDDDLTANVEPFLNLPSEPSDGTSSGGADAATPPSPFNISGVRTEVIRTTVGNLPPIVFDLERITRAWSTYLEGRSTAQTPQPAPRSSELESADLGADDENATAALARVLSKADFGSMGVVGQFNRGFIVARLCKAGEEGATDDLFIIDQHAADEKYNFETLQATTRLESQRLFSCVATLLSYPRTQRRAWVILTCRPRVLELTAADELVALENMGVLQQNGFEVAIEGDQPAGRRLKLVAQPVSKDKEFDIQGRIRFPCQRLYPTLTVAPSGSVLTDLEEILHLLRDRPSGTLVRSSKTRAMFAMRACRKSTMVGAPLNIKQMTTVSSPALHISQRFFFSG